MKPADPIRPASAHPRRPGQDDAPPVDPLGEGPEGFEGEARATAGEAHAALSLDPAALEREPAPAAPSRPREPRARQRPSAKGPKSFVHALTPEGQLWRLPLDALLLLTLVGAAFAYGAVEPWSQQLVAAAAVVAVVYTLVACLLPSVPCRPVASWTVVPIAAFLGLVVLQVLPLPTALVRVLGGGVHATRESLLADLGGAGDWQTLSLTPAATLLQLWPLLPVIAFFVVALHAYRSEEGVRRLAGLIALAGATVVGYAFYARLTGAGPSFQGVSIHKDSGPFLNHSAFGQFVNLGVGAAAGLLFVRVNRVLKKHASPATAWKKLTQEREHAAAWFLAAAVVLGPLAILLSLTRGGVISFLVAGGVVGVLLAWRGGRAGGEHSFVGSDKAALVVVLGLLVFVAALLVGFDAIYERVATLGDFDTAQAGRDHIVRDLVPAWLSYPWVGTGLGSFEWVYPKYDTGRVPLITSHAENEYAQLMLETGLVGLACAAAFVLLLARAAWRVIRRPVRSLDFLAFGLVFGWVAILLHSLSDFGQHLPAVAMMTGLTAAAIFNLAALCSVRPADDDGSRPLPTAQRLGLEAQAQGSGRRALRWGGPVLLTALAIGSGVGAIALEGPRDARGHQFLAEQIEDRLYGGDPDLILPGDDERLVRRWAAAAAANPADPDFAFLRDWFAWGLVAFTPDGESRELAGDPEAETAAREILARVSAARRLAPTHGPLVSLAGEIRLSGLGEEEVGAELVALGGTLTPHDPGVAITAGEVALEAGDRVAAADHFARAIELRDGMRSQVVEIYATRMGDPAGAYEIAAGDPAALRRLAALLKDDPEYAELSLAIAADLRSVAAARAYADNPRPDDLIAMARHLVNDGELEEAFRLYQRATALAPRRTAWRIELAELHAREGNPAEAVREARAVLQLEPLSVPATRLLEDQITKLGDTP